MLSLLHWSTRSIVDNAILSLPSKLSLSFITLCLISCRGMALFWKTMLSTSCRWRKRVLFPPTCSRSVLDARYWRYLLQRPMISHWVWVNVRHVNQPLNVAKLIRLESVTSMKSSRTGVTKAVLKFTLQTSSFPLQSNPPGVCHAFTPGRILLGSSAALLSQPSWCHRHHLLNDPVELRED